MAFRSSNSASTSVDVSSIDVTAPAGVATGDVVVCAASNDGATAVGLPSGVSALASSPLVSTLDNMNFACGTKYESGTPPATYTFTTAFSIAACVAAYSGRSSSGTVDASSGLATSTGAASPRTMPATNITTTVTCDLVFVASADWNASANAQAYTPPGSYTERVDDFSGGFPSITLDDFEGQAAGLKSATGTATASSGNAAYGAYLIGLAGVVAGPQTRGGVLAPQQRMA